MFVTNLLEIIRAGSFDEYIRRTCSTFFKKIFYSNFIQCSFDECSSTLLEKTRAGSPNVRRTCSTGPPLQIKNTKCSNENVQITPFNNTIHGTTLSSTTPHRTRRARDFWSGGTSVCGVILRGTSVNLARLLS